MSKDKQIHKHKTHYLLLHLGSWIEDIPEDNVKIIIAVSLNYCVYNEDVRIKGYLITQHHICLVIHSKKHSIHHILTVLSEQIEIRVYRYLKMNWEDEKVVYLDNQYSMFTKHILRNKYLIQLITGHMEGPPYYSPEFARLKRLTHNYNYCSVLNYVGVKGPAEGPVQVQIDKK
ncbi:hypothetical protein [Dokdonia sp.]|uniref:hypothetical protein n=1 Tax=Dokdonia sp. TaxID=2024995 RepID=UPI00326436D5